jgi:hypothetical protein
MRPAQSIEPGYRGLPRPLVALATNPVGTIIEETIEPATKSVHEGSYVADLPLNRPSPLAVTRRSSGCKAPNQEQENQTLLMSIETITGYGIRRKLGPRR